MPYKCDATHCAGIHPHEDEICPRVHKLLGPVPFRAHDLLKDSNPKDALGIAKPPLSTVPATVVAEVGVALMEGGRKYGRHNYRVIGVRAGIYYDACFRHMSKWWEGEDIDPDSGLSHVTKAIATLFVLRDAMIQDMLEDDRPPMAPPGFFSALEVQAKNVIAKYPESLPAYTQKAESEKEQG